MSVQASDDGLTLPQSETVDQDEEGFETPLSSPSDNVVPQDQQMVTINRLSSLL